MNVAPGYTACCDASPVWRNLGRQALVVSAVVAGGDSSPLCRGRRARERLLQSLNTTFLRGG